MKLLNFTIIKLTLCLSVGIVIAHFSSVDPVGALSLAFGSLAVLALAFIVSNRQIQKTIWFGCISFLTSTCLGILVYTLHNQQNFKRHYSNFVSVEKQSENIVTFQIREKLKTTNSYNRYIINILNVNNEPVLGKSLLNVLIDSTKIEYNVDDILVTSAPFKALTNPLNPNQFSYKNYLEKQYVYHQIFAAHRLLFKVPSAQHTVFGYAHQLRQSINIKLKQYHFKPDELAIINALLLGQRQDINEDIYNNYKNAGAVHILAVSGLHVGIVLLLLNFAFRPLEYVKHGKAIKVVVILLILWCFAIIAGLSASVTRAVTMFSIVAIAMNWKRPTNIYNTLAISIFILLLFKPLFLFDVGFQLSYLAVLAIVTIQPLLYKLWKPKWKPINFLWNIFTVTIAAQIGVLPISLYYFHQFPGLFFISNLVIIPFLGLILGYGIIVIILSLFNILPQIVATAYGHIINAMNTVVDWVAKQEQFLFKDISMTLLQVIISYLFIITLIKFYNNRTFTNLSLVLILVLLFQGAVIFNSYANATNELIIFHKNRFTLIGEKNGNNLGIYHNLDSLAIKNDRVINNFEIGNFITNINFESLKNVYQVETEKLLVVDSLGIYNVKTFTPTYILLRNSPKINLERLIDSIRPKTIIADGSNYKSYIDRWKATCTKQKLPFHNTSEKGAFIIK